MTSFSNAGGAGPAFGSARWGGGCAGRWHPLEIAAVVISFAFWWPLGLALLALRFAQRRGYRMGDLADRAQSAFGGFKPFGPTPRAWQPFAGEGTGNAAFDEWRKAEMARLEEEHRKLEAAQKEFAEHLDNLRRARDREEFESFMAARRNASPGA